jgi:hypothetical protein
MIKQLMQTAILLLATSCSHAGTIPNSNPIIINSLGYPTQGAIWLQEGQAYKFVLALPTDTDPPTSPVKTFDDVTGVGDNTIAVSQWVSSGVTPVYISASSFSVLGDQTSAFQPGRREQFTTSGGTVYGNILTSVFTTLTTVTMQMDSGQVLDSGLSVVNHSILLASPSAEPSIKTQSFTMGSAYGNFSVIGAKGATVASAATTSVFAATDGNVVDISGSSPITSFGVSEKAGYVVEGTFTGVPLLTQSANLNLNIGDTAVFNGTTTLTNVLTVNSITSGAIAIGDQITGTGITSGGVVTAFLTGTGGTGTYSVSTTQNVGPIAMTGVKSIQIAAGDKYRAVANTTSQIDVTITRKTGRAVIPPLSATQAEMEAAASLTAFATPGILKYLPNIPKAGCTFDGTLTGTNAPTAGFGITSITRTGAGSYTVNLSMTMTTSPPYWVLANASSNALRNIQVISKSANSFTISAKDTEGSGATVDVGEITLLVFGDLP